MDLIGQQDTMGRTGPLGIVIGQSFSNVCSGLSASIEGMQVDEFMFHGPPEAHEHVIVDPATLRIHRYIYPDLFPFIDPTFAGELGALICIEDL
jgi:hypothetical protein